MNKKVKKAILYIIYFILAVGLLLMVLSLTGDIRKVFSNLKSADITFILIALLLGIVYTFTYPISLNIFAKATKLKTLKRDVYLIGLTENFFNGITPFATGGQPFEAVALTKNKGDAATSTSVLLMNFVVFMMVTNTYALISLFFFNKFVQTTLLKVFAIIGFSINFLVLLFMISLGTSKTVKRILFWAMRTVGKIKFLHNFVEKKMPFFTSYVENTQSAFKELFKHKWAVILSYLEKALVMFIYYSIPFFCIKALNIDIGFSSLFESICGSAFATTMSVFMPTPGSSGGIEGAFASVFGSAFSLETSISQSVMIIWRLITYYLPIIIGLLAYVVYTIIMKRREKKEVVEDDACSL